MKIFKRNNIEEVPIGTIENNSLSKILTITNSNIFPTKFFNLRVVTIFIGYSILKMMQRCLSGMVVWTRSVIFFPLIIEQL